MANYSKAFNFRGGFQVDTDVLLVRGENVGIGSTIPEERLDVDGTIFARGLRIEADEVRGDITEIDKANVGILSVTQDLYVGTASSSGQTYFPQRRPAVLITTGIITSSEPNTGVVTYYGDGAQLLNLPTSQWLDVDPGIGFTSIYAQGNVGVATTMPVHTFQVGGSPFARQFGGMNVGMNTGVGIERGNIYASGIITTRGEFVGLGSLIVDLDARNLGIGTIPVERYGPLIVTDTVIASSFIGTATTAIGVRTDSFLDFDIGRANELEAVVRYISSEGKFQMGNLSFNDPVIDAGDIDIRKTAQTTVYALSEDNSSRIFVGKERNKGTQRRFGGFRFGGDPQDPDSQENDLDIVNYDIGNVNLYLHSGSGNINSTIGEFRFIYGKTDRVLTTINKNGRLRVNVNSNPNEASLDVVGFSTLRGDTYVGSDFYLAGDGKTLGDFEIGGRLILNDATLAGATFTQDVTVGQDPTAGVGDGVGIGTSGTVIASRSISVWGVGGPAVEATSSGDITLIGNVVAQQSVSANLVDANNIELNTAMVGPSNYALDSSGQTVDSSSVGTLKAVGGTISLRSPIEYFTLGITSTTISVDNINVAQSISGNFNITADNINILQDVNVSQNIFTQNFYATGITSSSILRGDNSSIGIADASSITVTGETNTDTLIANGVTVNGVMDADEANIINMTIGNVTNTPAFNSGLSVAGTVDTDTITSTDGTITNLTVTDLDVTNVTSNPTFSGNISVTGSLSVADLTATTMLAQDATINTLDVSTIDSSFSVTGNVSIAGTITGGDLQTNSITVTDVSTNTLGVNSVTTSVDFLQSVDIADNLIVGNDVDVANELTAATLIANEAEINTITSNVAFSGNVLVPGNITATSIGATNINVESLSADEASISTFTSSSIFNQGFESRGTIFTTDLQADQADIVTGSLGQVAITTVTNAPIFSGGADFTALVTISEASVGVMTAINIDAQNLNVTNLTNPNLGFSTLTGDNVNISDTLTVTDIQHTGTANLNDVSISGSVSGSVEFTDDITADSGEFTDITSTGTFNAGAIVADSLSVAQPVSNLSVDTLTVTSGTIDDIVNDTATSNTLTVTDLVITGTLSGGYTQSNPPSLGSLTVTDLTTTNLQAIDATITNLDVSNITSSPTGVSLTLSDTLTAASVGVTSALTVNEAQITELEVSGDSFLNDTEISGDLDVSGALTSGTLSITDFTASNADIQTLTPNRILGEVEFTGLSTGQYVEVVGDLVVEDLTATTVVANTFEGNGVGCFYYPATDIRIHPGFTNDGNLYFYVANGNNSNVKYGSIELFNNIQEP